MSIFDIFYKKSTKISARREVPKINKNLVVLMILDGLGVHSDKLGNAVLQAKTPFLDTIWSKGYSTLIHASGVHVGLPLGEPGNSEVGHLNIGSGQVIYQSLPRINDAIASGEFGEIDEIKKAFLEVKKRGSNMHFMGVLTAAGVHGNIEHLYALLEIAKKHNINPYIHVMLDGRDSPPTDGFYYVSKLNQKMKELGIGRIASVMGRLYGMDRDNRWERTEKAYNAMVGIGERTAQDVNTLIQDCYKREETDQFIIPTTIIDNEKNPIGPVLDNDIVFFYNFREDRARQITKVFVENDFHGFRKNNEPKNIYFVTMTGYSEDLETHVIFPPKKVFETLSSTVSDAGLKQLHVSETEKFMHVTYFFNGGIEKPHKGEEFFNVPSPKVFDYSAVPEMSAYIIRDEVMYKLNKLDKDPYSLIIINIANPDMVGHTGNLNAGVKACEVADEVTKDIVSKTIEKGGAAIIIADHGNCETMIDRETLKPHTAHTNNPVPFIVVADKSHIIATKEEKSSLIKIGTGSRAKATGILADVAPTALSILGLKKGRDMTGVNLLEVI